ncbi:WxL domain-containing protein [Enterococcus rotai]|uniref:WxL domain-containing protein n=1 Tax=Enterococcus rotai TaxID=118060 RepID=UPI0032B458B0
MNAMTKGTLATMTLLASVLLGGVSVSAAEETPKPTPPETKLGSEGKTIVEEGVIGPEDPTPDPEKPDENLPDNPDISVNPDSGSLVLQRVSVMNFGTIKTSTSEVKAHAAPITLSEGETRGAIVGWSDVRAGGTYGYTITAELTKQFTGIKPDTSNALTGATLNYTNGMAVPAATNKNTVPSNVATAFELDKDSGAKTVVTADKAKLEGKGSYVMEFGQSDKYTGTDGTKGTDKTAVTLTVPATVASNMVLDTYNAVVTWKIVAAV